jgi:hypothetical protein
VKQTAKDMKMSAKETVNGDSDPVLQPFIDLWTHCADEADATTRYILTRFKESATPGTWQRHWSEAFGKSMDAYMRSPAFLKTMKQNMDAAIKLKLHSDDVSSEVARNLNIPMASDISGLFERLHSVEETILTRLGHIEERLEVIEECALSRKSEAQSIKTS